MPRELIVRLDEYATANEMTLSAVIRDAVRAFLAAPVISVTHLAASFTASASDARTITYNYNSGQRP
jgi:hypothetical protein